MENTVTQKVEHRIIIWPSKYTLRYRSEKTKNKYSNLCVHMFTARLFTTAKRGKQQNCASTDEQINKLWPIYLATEKTEVPIHATTLMNLENTVVGESN